MNQKENAFSSIKDANYNNNYHINYVFLDSPIAFGSTNLYQVGRMFCNEKTVIGEHLHKEYFELTIITDGCGVITTNNLDTQVKKGDIFLNFPFDTHKITSAKNEPLQFDFLSFNTTNTEQAEKLSTIETIFKSPKLRLFNDALMVNFANQIIAEFSSRSILSEQIISSLLNLIILYVINDFPNSRKGLKYSLQTSDILCYQIMNFIETHLSSLNGLELVCKEFNYNYSYLSSLFKKTTGNSMRNFYLQKKFDYAKQLVIEGKKMYEVANILNYSNQYTFSKGFKKYFGISPKQMQLKFSYRNNPHKTYRLP